MLVSAGQVLTRVRGFLHDTDSANYRWSNETVVAYLNDVALEIAKLKADANPVRAAFQLTASQSLHDVLPADALMLDDITVNMGANGTTVGDVIRPADEESMGRNDRTWRASTPATTILQWLPAANEPKKFYTYPRVHAATQVWVEVVYRRIPDRMIYQPFQVADVDPATDIITLLGHDLPANSRVILPTPASGSVVPAPLVANTIYYVIVVDGNHIKLSATSGGAAINLTTTGTGENTIDSILTIDWKYKQNAQFGVAGACLVENRPEADASSGARFYNLFYASLGVAAPGSK